MTLGAGMFVGTWLSGVIGESATVARAGGSVAHDWARIWAIPALMSGAVLIAFAALFRDEAPVAVGGTEEGAAGRP